MIPIDSTRYRVDLLHVSEAKHGCGAYDDSRRFKLCYTRGELPLQGELRVMSPGGGIRAGFLNLRTAGAYRGAWGSCRSKPEEVFPGYVFRQLPIQLPPADTGRITIPGGTMNIVVEVTEGRR